MANKTIVIGNSIVGEGAPIYLIAEIGINHNGDMQIAKKLIDASFATGCLCVKFQKRTPEISVPDHQKSIMKDTPWGRITYMEYKKKIEFNKEQFDYINYYCKEKPITWSCSVWDLPSLNFICNYDIPLLKIPSAMLTNMDIIKESCSSGKVIILSTGMSTIEEIDEAVNCLEKYSHGDYVIMHTNSTYPTPHEELNLRVIGFLKDRYNCIVGYSGHEYDLEPTVAATVLGARVIERHITLDHNMWGTDQSASLEVHALDLLHKRLKNINTFLGDGIKRVTEGELEIRKKLRGQ